MNSRERTLTTLTHQEPDRIPFDLGSTQVTGIHKVAYVRLRNDRPPLIDGHEGRRSLETVLAIY